MKQRVPAPPRPLANTSREMSTQPMANNPDSTVLLTRALDICSSVVNLEIGSSALQGEARELLGLLAQFKPFIPEPGTRCGCGSAAVRFRDGQAFCYSCWMAGPRLSRAARLSGGQEETAGTAGGLSQGGLTQPFWRKPSSA